MSRITRNKQTHLSSKISFIKQVHDPIGSQNESVLISLEYKTFISLSPVVRLLSISNLDWNTHRETQDLQLSIWCLSHVKIASANKLQRHFIMSMFIHIPAKIQSHRQETGFTKQLSWEERRTCSTMCFFETDLKAMDLQSAVCVCSRFQDRKLGCVSHDQRFISFSF